MLQRCRAADSPQPTSDLGKLWRRYLHYWNSSFSRYLAEVDGLAADPGAGNASALLSDVNSLVFPDGS